MIDDVYYLNLIKKLPLAKTTYIIYNNDAIYNKKQSNNMTFYEILTKPEEYEKKLFLNHDIPERRNFTVFRSLFLNNDNLFDNHEILKKKWTELFYKYDIKKEVEVVDWIMIMLMKIEIPDELLLFDMYRRHPPFRGGDLWKVELLKNDQEPTDLKSNYIKNRILYLNDYKTYLSYGMLRIQLDDKIILPNRNYLFEGFDSRQTFNAWANKVVQKYLPSMTIHKFRHSFLRSKLFDLPNETIAAMMGHSIEEQLIYAYGYQYENHRKGILKWSCLW